MLGKVGFVFVFKALLRALSLFGAFSALTLFMGILLAKTRPTKWSYTRKGAWGGGMLSNRKGKPYCCFEHGGGAKRCAGERVARDAQPLPPQERFPPQESFLKKC